MSREGTTSNRYQVLGRLANGGMADIFLARVQGVAGVERYVVLKRVLEDRCHDAQLAQMFLDEARLAMQLQHPNIAQVYDIGRLDGALFFTMEYVHGEDLLSLLVTLARRRQMLAVAHALHIAAGALAALHHAHEKRGADGMSLGVVHRDVSPSNVMLGFDGTVKLLDFGVAKARQNRVASEAGTLKGKFAYMSPEQCTGAPIDRRSDVFSLGIVLYEMLTCTRLFKRATEFASLAAIVGEDVVPPSRLRPEISPFLDDIVLKALAKEPENRFPTAAAMLEAIEQLAVGESHVMSALALGRTMAELFGVRVEPWIELAMRGERTMTVECHAVSDIGVVIGESSIRRELGAVPQIGRKREPTPTPFSLRQMAVTAPTRAPLPGLPPLRGQPVQLLPVRTPQQPTLRVASRPSFEPSIVLPRRLAPAPRVGPSHARTGVLALSVVALISGIVAFALPPRSTEAAAVKPAKAARTTEAPAAEPAAPVLALEPPPLPPRVVAPATFVPTVPATKPATVSRKTKTAAPKRRPARVKRKNYCEERPLECYR